MELAVPVHNGELTLEASIRHLHGFLTRTFPFSWSIVIVDHGSSDRSYAIGLRLSYELGGVELIRLRHPGRGRAIRTAWSRSQARVLCYADVNLQADPRALLPLVAPLLSSHSDLAIGTRLAHGAHVRHSMGRGLCSRGYNPLLRLGLHAHFSDAQCPLKAIRSEVARELLPFVQDEDRFFDTELLVLAQRRELRIHEVAVDWREARAVVAEPGAPALAQLRGVRRLLLHRRPQPPRFVSPHRPILAP